MDKRITFFGKTEEGVFAQAIFPSLSKTADARPIIAPRWDTAEPIKNYIGSITAADRDRYCYVLVNALGAGEFFGSNINSDFFPWLALSHEGDDYGYKTFLSAHAFQHHRNKDAARAFGDVVLSVLNHRMKRVELIIRIDRAKATLEGAGDIVARIDAGEFPDVSMGCKVPFDVCSICGHQSKTRDDRCIHMKPPPELRHLYGPNKILPDGRRICVYNTRPRFFDISFVFIGADKTAKVMAKLAAHGGYVCLGDVCAVSQPHVHEIGFIEGGAYEDGGPTPTLAKIASAPCQCGCLGDCSDFDKLASAFVGKTAGKKLAEIVKEIPTGTFAVKRLPGLEQSEPDLPASVLDQMAGSPVSAALSGAAGMGIVLKPHEFQRMVLTRMGEGDMADDLDQSQSVFRAVPNSSSVDLGGVSENARALLPLLLQYLKARSAFGENFQMRVIVLNPANKIPLPTRSPMSHPLLDKISAAYNGYRKDLLLKLSEATEAVQHDSQLRQAVLGDDLVKSFSKTASETSVAGLDTVAYLMGVHLQDRGYLCTPDVAASLALHSPELLSEGLSSAQGF